MKRFRLTAGLLVLLSGLLSLRAELPDDQFVHIYNLIQQADSLAANGQADFARKKYLEADAGLRGLQKAHPGWNETVVRFRLEYIAEKLGPLKTKEKVDLPNPSGKTAIESTAPIEATSTIELLQEQIRQLIADKELLQAKLKEALTAQPAAVDPRELANAEGKIKSLQKEVEILQLNLKKAEMKPDKPIDPAVLNEVRKALASANQKVAQQSETVAVLTLEREALQKQLQAFIDGVEVKTIREENGSLKQQNNELKGKAEAGIKAGELKSQLAALQTDLATQRIRSEILDTEKKTLQNHLNELTTRRAADVTAKTRSLEKELTEARTVAQTNLTMVSALQTALKSAQEQKAALEKEKKGFEKKLTEAQTALVAARAATDNDDKSGPEAGKLKQHERERDELQKKFNTATNQAVALRARMAVLEANKVPYSDEEMALFNALELSSTNSDSHEGKQSLDGLPASIKSVMVEAERAFRSQRYDEAEKKYALALRLDDQNVFAMANLAAAQIELDRLAEAEANLKKALARDARDAFSLSLLGIVKIRQNKYDEALESLSQSAQLEPQNTDAFQYLGVALAGKGLRGPAESAFRRAIQIAPGNADAHHNLAVLYAAQHPSAIELARWHYQKALDAGHPKNPDLEKILKAGKSTAAAK